MLNVLSVLLSERLLSNWTKFLC